MTSDRPIDAPKAGRLPGRGRWRGPRFVGFWWLAGRVAAATAGASAATAVLFLVIDFADRAKIYTGAGWLQAVWVLYGCKAVVVAHQLAPAAFGLGAAVSVRSLRQTGEWTALESLGNGPARVLYPVAFVGLGMAGLLWGAEDRFVAPAHRRAEEITVQRFRRWGDWSAYNSPRHWFRGAEGRVYRLGHPSHDGYEDVTILEVDSGFRLQRRLDAARVDPAADGAWQMTGVVERRFGSDGAVSESRFDEKIERFREQIDLFQLKTGRPSQLSRADVVGQIALRERLGLPVREWKVTLQERRVYPFMLIPMGLAGAALALRRQRNGGLTTALGEGLGMTAAAWVLSLLGRTVAMAGHVDPLIGAVVPLLALSAVAVVLVRRAI